MRAVTRNSPSATKDRNSPGGEQHVLDEPQVTVLGRTTYQNMSGYFCAATGPIAAAMNAHPKLVFSRTLNEPLSWSNARLAACDPAAENGGG